jgi:hypothetical protein
VDAAKFNAQNVLDTSVGRVEQLQKVKSITKKNLITGVTWELFYHTALLRKSSSNQIKMSNG